MTLADTLVVMNGGVVEQIGRRSTSIASRRAASSPSFIGSPADEPAAGRVPDGALTIGVRAEDMRLSRRNGATEREPLKVAYVEELGSGRLVHGDYAGQRIVVAAPSGPELDEAMDLSIEPSAIHVFDRDNGRRVC
jgi:sn-glycerol 3-phosphate transport system ATP-binding protein